MLLGFAQKNRGMTRVLIGDALVNEDDAAAERASTSCTTGWRPRLKQALRFGVSQKEVAQEVDIAAQANLIMSFVTGRWHQFAKSGFKRDPAESWTKQWRLLMEGFIA